MTALARRHEMRGERFELPASIMSRWHSAVELPAHKQ